MKSKLVHLEYCSVRGAAFPTEHCILPYFICPLFASISFSISSILHKVSSVFVCVSQYATISDSTSPLHFLFFAEKLWQTSSLQGDGTDTCVGSSGSFSIGNSSGRKFLPLELIVFTAYSGGIRIGRFS